MFPKKFEECVAAVVHIALNSGGKPVSSREVCLQHGLHPRHLEFLMQKLVHAGVLRGARGPHGGYALAKERRKIYMSELFLILKEWERTAPANDDTFTLHPAVEATFSDLEQHILRYLEGISLEDVCNRAGAVAPQPAALKRGDFVI